jgi:hypothetical protein
LSFQKLFIPLPSKIKTRYFMKLDALYKIFFTDLPVTAGVSAYSVQINIPSPPPQAADIQLF